MAKQYIPQLGDVVRYKGLNMVVISIENRETLAHVSCDRTYYLLDESILECNNPTETQELLCRCIKEDIRPSMSKFPKFVKIASGRYKIQQIPYTNICQNPDSDSFA